MLYLNLKSLQGLNVIHILTNVFSDRCMKWIKGFRPTKQHHAIFLTIKVSSPKKLIEQDLHVCILWNICPQQYNSFLCFLICSRPKWFTLSRQNIFYVTKNFNQTLIITFRTHRNICISSLLCLKIIFNFLKEQPKKIEFF